MRKKIITSKGLIFKIDPSIKEVKIVLGEKFFYSSALKEFEIDENPYGDPVCQPLKNLKLTNDKLEFYTHYKGEDIHFSLGSKYKADKLFYPYFINISKSDFAFLPSDTDGIEIIYNKNKLESYILTKYENYISKDFLTIVLNNEKSIITYPFKKYTLKSIRIKESKLVFETDSLSIEWELKIHPFLLNLIKKLINLSESSY